MNKLVFKGALVVLVLGAIWTALTAEVQRGVTALLGPQMDAGRAWLQERAPGWASEAHAWWLGQAQPWFISHPLWAGVAAASGWCLAAVLVLRWLIGRTLSSATAVLAPLVGLLVIASIDPHLFKSEQDPNLAIQPEQVLTWLRWAAVVSYALAFIVLALDAAIPGPDPVDPIADKLGAVEKALTAAVSAQKPPLKEMQLIRTALELQGVKHAQQAEALVDLAASMRTIAEAAAQWSKANERLLEAGGPSSAGGTTHGGPLPPVFLAVEIMPGLNASELLDGFLDVGPLSLQYHEVTGHLRGVDSAA